MEKKIFILILIVFSVIGRAQLPKNQLGSQQSVFPKETVKLFVNSEVALAGEALYYKISVLNDQNMSSHLSKIGYVTLRDERDSIIFDHKLRLNNGNADGDFFLPAQLKTGVYQLMGYTNFSRNNIDHPFDFKKIYVVNTFHTNQINEKNADTVFVKIQKAHSVTVLNDNAESKSLGLKTDKLVYTFREKVKVNLSALNKVEGQFLISVRKINPLEIIEKPDYPKTPQAINFDLPELRGELISGKVLSKDGHTPLINATVAYTIPGKDFIFKMVKTDNYGKFFISVPENYNSDLSVLQLVEPRENRENYTIYVDDKVLDLAGQTSSFLKFDPALENWLSERSVQIQIENAYFDKKQDSVLPLIPSEPFYGNLGTVYNLDDYTRFNTLRETFTEIIKLAAIRGNGNSTRFLVYNPYDPNGTGLFNNIDPLVLLDGMMIQNNDDLMGYNAKNILSIRVINTPYRYGPKLFSGIISMASIKHDFLLVKDSKVKILDQPAPLRSKVLYNNMSASSPKRIPDNRVQLLWKPNIRNEDLKEGIYFYTSDIPGTYEINFEGYSEEGIYQQYKRYIEVK